jgi:hypothetical protein
MVRSRGIGSIVVLVLAVLVLAPAAHAGQPVTQTLNPPPPSFEPCKAVGSGTICSGEQIVSLNDGTGDVCGDGQSAFEIVISATLDQKASRRYDRDGNMTRRFIHDTYRSGRFINSVTGAAVPFTGHDTVTDVLAVPADFNTATETIHGELIVTLPHAGAVYLTAGTNVTAVADGTLEFQAGPGIVGDWFVNGAPMQTPEELCAALGSA